MAQRHRRRGQSSGKASRAAGTQLGSRWCLGRDPEEGTAGWHWGALAAFWPKRVVCFMLSCFFGGVAQDLEVAGR